MALRIKSHWHDDASEHSLPETAGAIAFIAWRVALDKAVNLHCKRFIYEDDAQRMGVIQEYLVFMIQIADRVAHDRLEEAERRALITALAKRLADHVQDNSLDLFGSGDYVRPFIDRLNERSAEYAAFKLTDEGPSYPFLRHLGHSIQGVMGSGEANRWVIDQVMDRDGWDVYRQLTKAMGDLLE